MGVFLRGGLFPRDAQPLPIPHQIDRQWLGSMPDLHVPPHTHRHTHTHTHNHTHTHTLTHTHTPQRPSSVALGRDVICAVWIPRSWEDCNTFEYAQTPHSLTL